MRVYEWAPGTEERTFIDLNQVQAITPTKAMVCLTLAFNSAPLNLHFPLCPERREIFRLNCQATQYMTDEDYGNVQKIRQQIDELIGDRPTADFLAEQRKFNQEMLNHLLEAWNTK